MRKLFLSVVLSMAIVAGMPFCASAANSSVRSVAECGYNYIAPENTLPAYKMAAAYGFTYVGADVTFTRDGMPVLLKDSTINRTARLIGGGSPLNRIYIDEVDYRDVLRYYDFGLWRGIDYYGTRILTFDEFLDFCSTHNLNPYVRLNDHSYLEKYQIEGLVDLASHKGMQDKITWLSEEDEYLEWVKGKYSRARLGLMESYCDGSEASVLERAKKLKSASNKVFLDLSPESVTDEMVRICKKDKMPIEVWNISSVYQIKELDKYVSGISTSSVKYEDACRYY